MLPESRENRVVFLRVRRESQAGRNLQTAGLELHRVFNTVHSGGRVQVSHDLEVYELMAWLP
jgi:hypothetical protein